MDLIKRITNAMLYGLTSGLLAMIVTGGLFGFMMMIYLIIERLGV